MLLKKKAYRKGVGFFRVSFNRTEGGTICEAYLCRHNSFDMSDFVCLVCDVVLKKKMHPYESGKKHLSYIPFIYHAKEINKEEWNMV